MAIFIDTPEAVAAVVDQLHGLPISPPSLYLDVEGIYLSRHGSVSILQIFVLPTSQTFLLDIHILQDKAFTTNGVVSSNINLKDILESGFVPKVFFDVRNDSDALFSHFGIRLAGIWDLQLMELASRAFSRQKVNGLGRCIEYDAGLTFAQKNEWQAIKTKGVGLFAPDKGGSYTVFNARPLSEDLKAYCAQDVHYLAKLWAIYKAKLSDDWEIRVLQASRDRVIASQAPDFNGKGMHMALGPVAWTRL